MNLTKLAVCCLLFLPINARLQAQQAAQSSGAGANSAGTGASPSGTIVRDPNTGKLYRQQLVTSTQPVTRWEAKPITQTVYDRRIVMQNVARPETVFVPRTQYVWQTRVRGRFNPFRRTTYEYKNRPVTNWVPTTQTVQTPVQTVQWVPRQQTTQVLQPVQSMETTQRLVLTEIPSSTGAPLGQVAQSSALINLPLFKRQSPWQAFAKPAVNSNNIVVAPAYHNSPPAVRTAAAGARSTLQSGLSATVLR